MAINPRLGACSYRTQHPRQPPHRKNHDWCYCPAMLDLGTIAGLHFHRHELHAFCPRCERWLVLDLERMIETGQGDRRLPITVRCAECGVNPARWHALPSGENRVVNANFAARP